jgi:UPF0755 protein
MYYREADDAEERSGCLGKIIFLLILLLFTGAVVIGGIFLTREIFDSVEGGDIIIVDIPEGSSTEDIAAILKEEGFIRSEYVFRIYSRITGSDGNYQCGKHKLQKGRNYKDIINSLSETTYADIETLTLSFPEGTTALAMAIKLEKARLCTVDEFIEACNTHVFDVPFFEAISSDENKFIKLEGFLYPDTYEFAVDSTVDEVILAMLKNFEENIYTDGTRRLINSSGLSLEENIILASIVEKETLGDDMYAQIAGVFLNRLHNSDEFPCLESDTCAENREGNYIYGVLGYYFNGDLDPQPRAIPANIWQAYDTYSHRGLPVGAICNPGLKAILGTLNPAEHGYYFFITDKDANYYWGVTDYDHSVNIDKVNEYNATH